MKTSKKIIAFLLAAALIFALAACSSKEAGQNSSQQASSGQDSSEQGNSVGDLISDTQDAFNDLAESSNLQRWKDLTPDTSRELASSTNRYPYVGIASSIVDSSMSPFNIDNGARTPTMYYIYETLLVQTGVGEYDYDLAKNYYYEDDTTIVFELYDYIHDSDGNPLTASDVVFSYETFIDSGFAADFDYYDHAEVVDDYTVRFYLTQPIESLTAFDTMFTRTEIITEKAWNEHDMITDPVGTGPYVNVSHIVGASMELEAYDDYWQTEDLWAYGIGQNVQTVHFDFGLDSTTKTLALISGDSWYAELASTEVADFMEGGKYEGMFNIYTNMGMRILEILPNCSEDSPMNDINLRLACFYAIDSGTILEARGAATTTVAVVGSGYGTGDYNPEWDKIESYHTTYDPELAKEYLEKSNYSGETIRIIYTTGMAGTDATAQVVQGFLLNIGINCELCPYEGGIITDYIKDPTMWDLYLLPDGDISYTITRLMKFYSVSYGTVDGCTLSFIDDPEFQEALTSCSTQSGYSSEATEELLRYIIDNAYGYSTCYVMDLSAWNKDMASIAYTFHDSFQLYGACNWYLD